MSYFYSDMETGLSLNPNGNVKIVYDEDCIKQSITHIFRTVTMERVRNPIGTKLLEFLFQPINKYTAKGIQRELTTVITKYEPRVTLESLLIKPDTDNHVYYVTLVYVIEKMGKRITYKTRMRSFNGRM